MNKKGKPSILIVDDDKQVLKSLKIWLKKENFRPMIASNGNEALKIIGDNQVDVALVDLRMSVEDGITVSKNLKEADEDLKIVMLTGFPSYETAVRAIKIGVFDYISKGSSNEKILDVLKKAVAERRKENSKKKDIFGINIIKLILFCNHSLIKERLESFSNDKAEFKLVKSFPTIDYMRLNKFSQGIDIALVCASCNMSNFKDAYTIFPALYRFFPGIKTLIINENFSDQEKVELLKLGICGFSSRNLGSEKLERALVQVNKGELWSSRNVMSKSLKDLVEFDSIHLLKNNKPYGLTEREKEILRIIIQGLNNREIAAKLFISEKTVKTHINRIFKKLGVKSRTKAILKILKEKGQYL